MAVLCGRCDMQVLEPCRSVDQFISCSPLERFKRGGSLQVQESSSLGRETIVLFGMVMVCGLD